MEDLRIYSYLAVLASTLLWFFCKGRKVSTGFVKVVFFLAALAYLTLLVTTGGGVFQIPWILARDLAVLAIVAFVGWYVAESTLLFSLAVLVLALALKFFYFGGAVKSHPSEQFALDPAGELLVDLGDPGLIDQVTAALQDYGVEATPAFPNLRHPEYSDLDDFFVLNLADDHIGRLQEIIDEIYETGAVDWVERNEVIELYPPQAAELEAVAGASEPAASIPDLGVDDPFADRQWALTPLRMGDFYQALADGVEPAKQTTIAILDTGVDGSHEDLKQSYISTDRGFDNDRVGHGTHCAGVAAAVTDNGVGIASMASPGGRFVRVTSIRVLAGGSGTQLAVIRGMIRAADEGADVLSMSLGGPSNDQQQRAYAEAVKYADRSGALVVVSAGNNGGDAKHQVPAGVEGVIVVTALDRGLSRAQFSNHIENIGMGIAAPGVDIYSTFPGNQYKPLSGTSMATPYVAGLLGVMKALDPDLDTQRAYQLLDSTGVDTGDTEKTGRLIQPAAALAAMRR